MGHLIHGGIIYTEKYGTMTGVKVRQPPHFPTALNLRCNHGRGTAPSPAPSDLWFLKSHFTFFCVTQAGGLEYLRKGLQHRASLHKENTAPVVTWIYKSWILQHYAQNTSVVTWLVVQSALLLACLLESSGAWHVCPLPYRKEDGSLWGFSPCLTQWWLLELTHHASDWLAVKTFLLGSEQNPKHAVCLLLNRSDGHEPSENTWACDKRATNQSISK